MKALLIGYGQIGRAVYEVFSGTHAIDIYDTAFKEKPEGEFDILLVAIPYGDKFVDTVNQYRRDYAVKATIIFSTVAIGTTRQILGAVHSPVEGKHPQLSDSIRMMPRWVGGYNKTVERFFNDAGFKPIFCEKPEITEFLKLRSTSRYGINIEFARYEKSVCDDLGMDYEYIRKFDQDYNELYRELGMPQYQRYILFPPVGNCGGHCVGPNARLLDAQYPSWFLKEIYRDKISKKADAALAIATLLEVELYTPKEAIELLESLKQNIKEGA